jgi:integrase
MSVIASRYSLYRRSNRIYYIGYYTGGRRRWKSTGTTTKSEALEVLREFGNVLQETPRDVPTGDFIEKFLAYSEGNHAKNTVRLFSQVLNNFLLLMKHVSLREITPEHIDRYKTKRLREIRPVSVNIELRMLKSAFATALRWKLIDENPCKGVPFARIPDQAPVFLTPKDFERLIRAIPHMWMRELVVFAVITGLRMGEILNLCWRDVDLDRGIIHIQSSPRFRTKQGRRRTVPLNITALAILKSRRETGVGEYVFTLNGQKISADWLTHLFKRYMSGRPI